MILNIENIGIIKKANIELNGLTVIAGENDTGKSTVGRAFYYSVKNKSQEKISIQLKNIENKQNSSALLGAILGFGAGLLGDGGLPAALGGAAIGAAGFAIKDNIDNSKNQNNSATLSTSESKNISNNTYLNIKNDKISNSILIETPYSLNTASYIKTTQLLAQQRGLNYTQGDHIIDLILQLSQTKFLQENKIYNEIEKVINGKVIYDPTRDDFFYKKNIKKEFAMNSTATGIKMFGFIQILLLNGTIRENTVLILDEPEVHLHPKWQLKYAEILVELVKNGIKIVVTSHSPYMIEALQRYAKKEKIKSDFYLAEDGRIDKIEDDNSKTLSKIFAKLSEPFDDFDEMDSEALQNG